MDRRLAAIVAVMVSGAGCGGTPTSPSSFFLPPSATLPPLPPGATLQPVPTPGILAALVGNWAGSIRDPISGNGTMQLSLGDPIPTGQHGTWSATFTNGDRLSGVTVGGLGSDGLGLMLYAAEKELCGGESTPLAIALINVVVASNRLTADTGRFTCSGLRFGEVSLLKQ